MSSLIPEITITEFKKLKVPQIKRLKSCEVFENGEYLFTFINPSTDYIRMQSEYKGQLSNGAMPDGGETLEQILKTGD